MPDGWPPVTHNYSRLLIAHTLMRHFSQILTDDEWDEATLLAGIAEPLWSLQQNLSTFRTRNGGWDDDSWLEKLKKLAAEEVKAG